MSYQSDIQGMLAMVERGCARFMRTGGGALIQDTTDKVHETPIRPISIEEKQQMLALVDDGVAMTEISRILHRPYNSVARCTRRYRIARGLTTPKQTIKAVSG